MTGKMKITSYEAPAPGDFAFTEGNLEKARAYKARYPEDRTDSALLWILYLAQEQNGGWLSREAIDYVAQLLGMAPIRVYEVVSFYTMFNLAPKGKHLLQVCRTTSCWIRGSDAIVRACLEAAGTSKLGETSKDGLFTVVEVECLGACANAPVFQLNDKDYFEDLSPARAKEIIEDLRLGKVPSAGSQVGRTASEASEASQVLLTGLTDKNRPAGEKS